MSESFDEQVAIADVYAEALFALADEAGATDAVRGELAELVGLARAVPGFGGFLESRAVDDDDRRESLERMFRGKLSDVVLNTLQVMNDNGRVALLEPLLRAYERRLLEAAGQVEVRVSSAVELDAEQRTRVEKLAAELSGKEPLVTYAVAPEILGGLVLRIGDYRYDGSVFRRLHDVRAQLMERGAQGLAISAET